MTNQDRRTFLGIAAASWLPLGLNPEPEQVLPAGATFYEPTGALHTGTGPASTEGRTRALVFMVVPKGAPLGSPA